MEECWLLGFLASKMCESKMYVKAKMLELLVCLIIKWSAEGEDKAAVRSLK